MTYTLIDNMPRSIMGEGRDKGLGTAFATFNDGVFTTVMAITTCKDFLNDVVASEAYGYVGTNYGFATKPEGVFKNGVFMVMSVLLQGRSSPKPYAGMEIDIISLDANWPHIQTLLRWFEEQFKVDGRTIICPISSNMYGLIVPPFWARTTYLISLYGLAIRAGMRWDGQGDPWVFIKTPKNEDAYHWTAAIPKIERMIGGEFPPQDIKITPAPHHQGIQNFPFPPPSTPAAPPSAFVLVTA